VRPLLAMIVVLACVTALPRRSVGKMYPFKHEVLRGYLVPDVTPGFSGGLLITFRLDLDPESSEIEGSLRCRTTGSLACVGRQGALSNISVSQRENSPREAFLHNFDADVTFVPEGVSCHFMGVTLPLVEVFLESISGSYVCTTTSGSVVQTGKFGSSRGLT